MNYQNKLNALACWFYKAERVTAVCCLSKSPPLHLIEGLEKTLDKIIGAFKITDSDPILLGIEANVKMLKQRCVLLRLSTWHDRFVDTGRKSVHIAIDVVGYAFEFRRQACMPPELLVHETDRPNAIKNIVRELTHRAAYPVCTPGKNIIHTASTMTRGEQSEVAPENADNPYFDVCVWCKLFFSKVGFNDVAEQKKRKCECFGENVVDGLTEMLSKTSRYATFISDRSDREAFREALNLWDVL